MESIVRSFLERDMLISPTVFNELKGKENEIQNILKSIEYSLMVNSLEIKPQPEAKQEEAVKKPQSTGVFGKFVNETKTEAKAEMKTEQVEQKPETNTETEPSEATTEMKQETKAAYKHDIKPIKVFETKSTTHGIDEFIKSSNERYEFLRKILSEKVDLQNLTSINKIDPMSEVSIIGVVKSIDKKERTLLDIEDSTGSIKVIVENDGARFLVGDVVGFSGMIRKEFFSPKKIVFPDIPIKRNIVSSENDVSAMFCGKISPGIIDAVAKQANENKVNYIFVTGKQADVERIVDKISPEMKIIYSPIYLFTDGNEPYTVQKFNSSQIYPVSSPSTISVEGVSMLVYNGSSYEKLPRNDEGVLEILKRRYIPLKLSAENFLIDNVPDVIYSALDKASVRNHKGSTLVSCDDGNAVILNLKTRETKIVPLVVS